MNVHNMPSADIARVRSWLAQAGAVTVLTGAGVSAESGIPTFRGDAGLWKQYRPEDLATPEAFRRNPKLVWEWYDWRRCRIAEAVPNPAHYALAGIEAGRSGFTLVTQNVDGLHDLAGSNRILKLHGDIWLVRCLSCGRESVDRRAPLPEIPPQCGCGGMLRPGVVWFGEMLPRDVLAEAETAASRAELFLFTGTSAIVYPAAGLIQVAQSAGARVVEVNLEATPYSGFVDVSLRGKAGEILPLLVGHNA